MLSATTGTANSSPAPAAFSRVRFQMPAIVTPGTSANALMCSRGHGAAADHGDAHPDRPSHDHAHAKYALARQRDLGEIAIVRAALLVRQIGRDQHLDRHAADLRRPDNPCPQAAPKAPPASARPRPPA